MALKKIMVVYECRVSGGTDRLLIHLIKNWPDKDTKWVLYLHHENSGINLIRRELSTTNTIIHIYYISRNDLSHIINTGILFVKKVVRKVFKYPLIWMNFFRAIRYFRKQLIAEFPDLLYLHNGGYPGSLDEHAASVAARMNKNSKIIMGIQNIPALTKRNITSQILNSIDNLCIDAFIFGNKRSEKVYRRETYLDKTKFYSINEGVNVNTNNIYKKDSEGIIKIGMIGSYERRKGHRR